MPDRKPQQRVKIDPDVAELLAGLERLRLLPAQPDPESKKKVRERARMQARREYRATYDLPPVLREQVKALAEQQRVPASQIVTLALARFMNEYTAGIIDLDELKRPSRSPRYDWNLAIPPNLLPASPKKKKKD